eukprot:scaffold305763_cov29-Prasinocladus_malaysianus.AAC.1
MASSVPICSSQGDEVDINDVVRPSHLEEPSTDRANEPSDAAVSDSRTALGQSMDGATPHQRRPFTDGETIKSPGRQARAEE